MSDFLALTAVFLEGTFLCGTEVAQWLRYRATNRKVQIHRIADYCCGVKAQGVNRVVNVLRTSTPSDHPKRYLPASISKYTYSLASFHVHDHELTQ